MNSKGIRVVNSNATSTSNHRKPAPLLVQLVTIEDPLEAMRIGDKRKRQLEREEEPRCYVFPKTLSTDKIASRLVIDHSYCAAESTDGEPDIEQTL